MLKYIDHFLLNLISSTSSLFVAGDLHADAMYQELRSNVMDPGMGQVSILLGHALNNQCFHGRCQMTSLSTILPKVSIRLGMKLLLVKFSTLRWKNDDNNTYKNFLTICILVTHKVEPKKCMNKRMTYISQKVQGVSKKRGISVSGLFWGV